MQLYVNHVIVHKKDNKYKKKQLQFIHISKNFSFATTTKINWIAYLVNTHILKQLFKNETM